MEPPIEVEVTWLYDLDEDTEQTRFIESAKQVHPSLFTMDTPTMMTATVLLGPKMTREMFRETVRVAFDMSTVGAQILDIWEESNITPLDEVNWKGNVYDVEAGKTSFSVLIQKRKPQDSMFDHERPLLPPPVSH